MADIPKHVLDWLDEIETRAYQRGWDDATRALVEAAAQNRLPNQRPMMRRKLPADLAVEVPAGETTRQMIARALRENPSGLRAAEVPRWLSEQATTKFNEGTVHTFIKRMLRDGSLTRDDQRRLYLVGDIARQLLEGEDRTPLGA
jgi:hypothetical protein